MDRFDKTALDETRDFLAQILYAKPEQLDALALILAVTHSTASFNTLPRVGAFAKEQEAGKTVVLDAAKMMAANVMTIDGTSYGMKNGFIDNGDQPSITVVKDEIHHVFGENGLRGRTNPMYDLLLRGYKRGATHAFGSNQTRKEVSIYGVAFLAGRGSNPLPDDLMSRTIRFNMVPKPARVMLLSTDDAAVEARGKDQGRALHAWVQKNADAFKIANRNLIGYRVHPKLDSRRQQIWGPLFAVAQVAGSDWPARCKRAFSVLALDGTDKVVLSTPNQALMDVAGYFRETGDVFATARALADYLWDKVDNKSYPEFGPQAMANLLTEACGPTVQVTNTHLEESGYDGPVTSKSTRGRWASDVLALAAELEAKLAEPEDDDRAPDDWELDMQA